MRKCSDAPDIIPRPSIAIPSAFRKPPRGLSGQAPLDFQEVASAACVVRRDSFACPIKPHAFAKKRISISRRLMIGRARYRKRSPVVTPLVVLLPKAKHVHHCITADKGRLCSFRHGRENQGYRWRLGEPRPMRRKARTKKHRYPAGHRCTDLLVIAFLVTTPAELEPERAAQNGSMLHRIVSVLPVA